VLTAMATGAGMHADAFALAGETQPAPGQRR